MTSQSEVARAWKVSRAYVNQLVKRGMPLDSILDATKWREANAMKKAAVDKKRHSRPARAEFTKPAEEPAPAGKGAGRGSQKAKRAGSTSLEDQIATAVLLVDEAGENALHAMRTKDMPVIPGMLSIHTKALEGRLKAEAAYQEMMKERETLVPKSAAIGMIRKALDAITSRLKRLPQVKSPQCNPQAPMVAFKVLDLAVNEILKEAQSEFSEYVQPAA